MIFLVLSLNKLNIFLNKIYPFTKKKDRNFPSVSNNFSKKNQDQIGDLLYSYDNSQDSNVYGVSSRKLLPENDRRSFQSGLREKHRSIQNFEAYNSRNNSLNKLHKLENKKFSSINNVKHSLDSPQMNFWLNNEDRKGISRRYKNYRKNHNLNSIVANTNKLTYGNMPMYGNKEKINKGQEERFINKRQNSIANAVERDNTISMSKLSNYKSSMSPKKSLKQLQQAKEKKAWINYPNYPGFSQHQVKLKLDTNVFRA